MEANKKKEITEWVITFAAAIVIALLVRFFVFEFAVVRQTSMYPNLVAGNKVGVFRLSYLASSPERGDIIVIKVNEKENYIKRVIALSGETIEIRDCVVYINGEALNEEYVSDDLIYSDFAPFTVSEEHVFVMGDNRDVSIDSRDASIGEIAYSEIIGKAVFRLSPWTYYGF